MRREDLVHLVAAPVLRQLNLNTVAVMEAVGDLRESVEMIARQLEREIQTGDPEKEIQ